jgi:hypothetical protein
MIHYNNIYCQQTNVNGFQIFLYNVYYDNRESIKKVRVLTVTENQNKYKHNQYNYNFCSVAPMRRNRIFDHFIG